MNLLNNIKLILIILFINASNVLLAPIDEQSNCDSYSNCPKTDPQKLNVHLVPHTHDDVGWLKTVDQYYYGSKNGIQRAGVQYIIDSVVRALHASPNRRFIYVETAFFWKWYNEQNQKNKDLVHELVNKGQLEFIGGGWSMNDEGAAHYNSMIDQMTWGFRRLKDTFGSCGIPKIGWQIDPFGHSREQASLFAQMNFDALFFARLDFEDQKTREKSKTLELIWSGNEDLGKSSNLFTNVMDKHYSAPNGFCFDLELCNDEPFIDDRMSEDYNVNQRVDAFIKWSKDFGSKYVTNNIMVPMGDDFMYQNAEAYFLNIDKLIKYVNMKNDSGINVLYSTPSCYARAVQQSKHTFTVKTDDFLPYADAPHSFVVGYFTSRPTQKYYERYGNNFLQVCKQLDSMAVLSGTDELIAKLREEMGVMQHHDAITGTEKQNVANDYALRLYKGITKCESVIQKAFNKLMTKDEKIPAQNQIFCQSLNISSCDISERLNQFTITIYNPIGRHLTQYVRIPAIVKGSSHYVVTSYDGKDVNTDMVPLPDYVLNIPGRKSISNSDLSFKAEVPPLGFSTYFVKITGNSNTHSINAKLPADGDKIPVKGKSFTIYFDANTGAIDSITLTKSSEKIDMKQSFEYYKSKTSSSAYTFNPDGTKPINLRTNLKSKFVNGKSVTEIQQTYNSWIGNTIRVYPDEDYVEFDWVVGPVPFADNIGKEILLKFETNLASNKIFYTDSNGRQMMKRVRDHRDTWNYTVLEPVSGNYYPINSRIAIRDESRNVQLTVLSDRSQGGSSISDGHIELMIHRRLLCCNAAVEALNETGVDGKGLVVRGKHYLFASTISDAAKLHRDLAQKLFMSPLLTFANYSNEEDYRKKFVTQYAGLSYELPPNVHLLTLEQWKDSTYLLRLEHFYQSKDDPNGLSKPATVELKNLFKSFTIIDAKEMTLGANQLLGERKRLEFDSTITFKDIPFTPIDSTNFTVKLNPMQIRTFVINIKKL